MKSSIYLFLICLCLQSCQRPAAEIKFNNQDFLFNAIKGTVVIAKFKYRNVGSDSLKILSVDGECGCTQFEFSKKPLPPGGTAEITAKYNSSQDPLGAILKLVLVQTNTEPQLHHLYIKGALKSTKLIKTKS